ncbi:hypothetical protein TNCV_3107721 [Trichonephila clavipes]|uniref:Uncharacterized protein n=1 Tax=Trichonephila clavipes TaxID=2585209 RepID=A0A8X6SFM9_TRICX|nr:hypothetical protein TNCV_3107721 [Trichonephila clavipes]
MAIQRKLDGILEADRERDANQPNPNRAQKVTYPAYEQVKEEIACDVLNRSLDLPLQQVGVHYTAER